MNNVAKGLKRNELPYILDVIDFTLRPMLERLSGWKTSISYNFQINAGKCGKYVEQLLLDAVYQIFLATYTKAESEALWQAMFTMSELFHKAAIEIGCQLDLTYNISETLNSMKYLRDVHFPPRDVKKLYK